MPRPRRLTLRLQVHARNWGDKVLALQGEGVDVSLPIFTSYTRLTFPPGWKAIVRANPTFLVVDQMGEWRLEFVRDGQGNFGRLSCVF